MTPKPKCVITTGRPGAGKTTLAIRISELLHLPRLSRDELQEGYVTTFGKSHEKLPRDTNRKVSNLFFSVTRTLLASNVSVVVEAAFQHRLWKKAVPEWLYRKGRELGLSKITGNVLGNNERALRFYESLGFDRIGEGEPKVERGGAIYNTIRIERWL